jgi:AraC-like DNA-binding protein
VITIQAAGDIYLCHIPEGIGVSEMAKAPRFHRKYLSLKALARRLGCPERRLRKYCERGEIPEARKTPGGHWRIRHPVSEKTKWVFAKVKREWPFGGSSDAEGEFDSDHAERVMTAQALKSTVEEVVSDPVLVYRYPEEKRQQIAQIEKAISAKETAGKGFHDLQLIEAVYTFWREHHREPTIGEIAKKMKLSRSTFYRKGLKKAFANVIYAVTGEAKAELPKTDTFTPSENPNSDLDEKSDFSSNQREPNADD